MGESIEYRQEEWVPVAIIKSGMQRCKSGPVEKVDVFIVKIEIRLKLFKGGSDGRRGVYNSRQAGN